MRQAGSGRVPVRRYTGVWAGVSMSFALLAVLTVSAEAQTHVSAAAVPVRAAEATSAQSPSGRSSKRVDGLLLQTSSGDLRVQFGLLLHADTRLTFDGSSGCDADTFVFRRVRPYVRGQVAHRFEVFLNPDFSSTSAVVVQDLYVDTAVTPRFHVRIGKQKTPFGLERLQSALNLLFLERALPTSVAPNRDIGVQAIGDIHGGLFSYLGAVMNGVADGGSYDSHATDGKEVSGRMTVRPFNTRRTHPLNGLALAISGSVGDQTGTALRSFRTSTLLQRYFSYAAGVVNDGTRTRYSPQVSYFHGRFGGFSEYVHSEAPLRRAAVRQDIAHRAWQVAGSWVLTGEAATDATTGVRPRATFDPAAHHWGALQVAGRYHALTIDDEAIALRFATPGSSRTAAAWTGGLNWYLSENIRCTGEVERTVFDDQASAARRPENIVAFRTQLTF